VSGVHPLVTVAGRGRPALSFALGAVAVADDDYAPAVARQLAPSLASSVAKAKYSYDRALARRFQLAAGIPADGVYGGDTVGALRYYGITNPPRALFAPTTEQPYSPPASAAAPAPAPSPSAPRSTTTTAAPYTPKPAATVVSTPNRRQLAQRAVDAVRAFIRSKGRPPAVALPAVANYQGAAMLKRDGLWGPAPRTAAARDLGVKESSLPRSAYDRPAAAPRPAPAPVRPAPAPVAPRPAPAPVRPAPAPVAPRPAPAPVRPAAGPSRRQLAQRAVDAVRAFAGKHGGKSPAVALPAVANYQGAAGLARDGLWGAPTRAAAARDLGVRESSLPAAGVRARKPGPVPPVPGPFIPPPPPSPVPGPIVIIDPPVPEPVPVPVPVPVPAECPDRKWLMWAGLGYLYMRGRRRAA
jgi:peptidoglycan hydrolase-like protein with peptidoglycan-binding domain